jgi:urea-proton symporter
MDGGINVDNFGRDEIMLTGNLVAILSSGFICTGVSLIKPETCDWSTTRSIALIEDDPSAVNSKETEEELETASKIISVWGIGLSLLLIVVWPLLTLPFKNFSKGCFTFWVVITILWGLLAFLAMTILPVWESKEAIVRTLTGNKVAAKKVEDAIDA